MKKLEDISKVNIFEVPEGYFEKLPGVIQARVAKPEPKVWFTPAFRFAMPVVALVLVVSLWITSRQENSIEEQLSEIQTQELLAYLDESELSLDLLTEEVNVNEVDIYGLEEEVFSAMEPFDITVEELSAEPENF